MMALSASRLRMRPPALRPPNDRPGLGLCPNVKRLCVPGRLLFGFVESDRSAAAAEV